MWEYLSAPFVAASALLVVAGVPTLRDPAPLVRALSSAGMPSGRLVVRCIAAAEVAIGLWALAAPGALSAGLVAATYAGFTGFVALALARGGVLGSCGCFGKPDTPPTAVHVALTALASLAALAVAVNPPADAWGASAGAIAGLLAGAALIGFLSWQALAVLPTVTPAAVRSTGRG